MCKLTTNEQCQPSRQSVPYLSTVLESPCHFYEFCVRKSFYCGYFTFFKNYFNLHDTLGLKMPQTAGIKEASCSRCGFKHSRPVGIRCKRTLNSSTAALRDAHSSDEEAVAHHNMWSTCGYYSSTGASCSIWRYCSFQLQPGV